MICWGLFAVRRLALDSQIRIVIYCLTNGRRPMILALLIAVANFL